MVDDDMPPHCQLWGYKLFFFLLLIFLRLLHIIARMLFRIYVISIRIFSIKMCCEYKRLKIKILIITIIIGDAQIEFLTS